jgi:hypothetical protein
MLATILFRIFSLTVSSLNLTSLVYVHLSVRVFDLLNDFRANGRIFSEVGINIMALDSSFQILISNPFQL